MLISKDQRVTTNSVFWLSPDESLYYEIATMFLFITPQHDFGVIFRGRERDTDREREREREK